MKISAEVPECQTFCAGCRTSGTPREMVILRIYIKCLKKQLPGLPMAGRERMVGREHKLCRRKGQNDHGRKHAVLRDGEKVEMSENWE